MSARKLRVAVMIDSLSPFNVGGGEMLATHIAMRLDPDRFERTLISTRPSIGPVADGVREAGVRLFALERKGKLALRAWLSLIAFLRRERIDVLHAHKFGSNVWGTLLGRIARVPVVIAHEHSWSYEGQPLRRFLDRELVGRGADAFLAVSREDRRRMIEIEGVKPEKARFLPIGIPKPPPLTGRDIRAELGLEPDALVVGTVSALRPEKALDVLLRAASLLAPELPGLAVVIGGEGGERPRLEALARELGLEQTVHFLGFWLPADVPDLLAALDVGVNSSDREGSALSLMEVMAAGKPVVATRVGGTPDLIEDGVHGLLVPPQDERALADALRKLLTDPALRAEQGARAKARQQAEFDVDVMVRRLEELYVELHGRERSRWRAHVQAD